MSDNVLKLIPTVPSFLPTKGAQDKARKRLGSFVPIADEIKAIARREVEFIDQGGNFEKVSCPLCGRALDTEWWQEAMGKAAERGFVNLDIQLPCCQKQTSLNELGYDWPAGFARFSLEARNPGVKMLKAEQIRAVEQDLGCQLRVIWAHY